jgi:indolepyruvate ferredoxin oxidoreductase beta subunit
LIGRGDADVLLAFEPLEALRSLPFCGPKTTAIVNTRPIVPFTVSIGQGVYPEVPAMLERIAAGVGRLIAFDATALAEEAGSAMAINAVLLGALARANATPIDESVVRRVVVDQAAEKFRASNAKAFDSGAAVVGQAGRLA